LVKGNQGKGGWRSFADWRQRQRWPASGEAASRAAAATSSREQRGIEEAVAFVREHEREDERGGWSLEWVGFEPDQARP
jgi:hypothetical protein